MLRLGRRLVGVVSLGMSWRGIGFGFRGLGNRGGLLCLLGIWWRGVWWISYTYMYIYLFPSRRRRRRRNILPSRTPIPPNIPLRPLLLLPVPFLSFFFFSSSLRSNLHARQPLIIAIIPFPNIFRDLHFRARFHFRGWVWSLVLPGEFLGAVER